MSNYYKEYNNKYRSAMNAYDKALEDFLKVSVGRYDQAQQTAQQEYGKYAGEEGYRKSVQLGQETASQLAGSAAGQAQSQATAASRAQGLSRSQAALLGAQQAAGAYGNVLNNQMNAQQQAAYGAGIDRAQGLTGAAYQTAQGVSDAYDKYAGGQATRTGMYDAARQSERNRQLDDLRIAFGLGDQALGLTKTLLG